MASGPPALGAQLSAASSAQASRGSDYGMLHPWTLEYEAACPPWLRPEEMHECQAQGLQWLFRARSVLQYYQQGILERPVRDRCFRHCLANMCKWSSLIKGQPLKVAWLARAELEAQMERPGHWAPPTTLAGAEPESNTEDCDSDVDEPSTSTSSASAVPAANAALTATSRMEATAAPSAAAAAAEEPFQRERDELREQHRKALASSGAEREEAVQPQPSAVRPQRPPRPQLRTSRVSVRACAAQLPAVPSHVQLMCNKGHRMILFIWPVRSNDSICNMCRIVMTPDKDLYRCTPCDFDLCEGCQKQRRTQATSSAQSEIAPGFGSLERRERGNRPEGEEADRARLGNALAREGDADEGPRPHHRRARGGRRGREAGTKQAPSAASEVSAATASAAPGPPALRVQARAKAKSKASCKPSAMPNGREGRSACQAFWHECFQGGGDEGIAFAPASEESWQEAKAAWANASAEARQQCERKSATLTAAAAVWRAELIKAKKDAKSEERPLGQSLVPPLKAEVPVGGGQDPGAGAVWKRRRIRGKTPAASV